jgi:hypothetical protein
MLDGESTRNTPTNTAQLAAGDKQLQELLLVYGLRHGFHGVVGVAFVIADGTIQKIRRTFEHETK